MKYSNKLASALTLVCSIAGISAAAEVVLKTEVMKVERFLAEGGEVEVRLLKTDEVIPGDELRYTITFSNNGDEAVDAGSVVITNPIPDSTAYLDATAFGAGTRITYSIDGGESFDAAQNLKVTENGRERPAAAEDYTTLRWTFSPELAPGRQGYVSFNVRLN